MIVRRAKFLIAIQWFLTLLNGFNCVRYILHRGSPFLIGVTAAAAGVSAGAAMTLMHRLRRYEEIQIELGARRLAQEALEALWRNQQMLFSTEAQLKAEANLRQVAMAVGARVMPNYCELTVGDLTFVIQNGYITRKNRASGSTAGTCFQHGHMPLEEGIASVLLILKDDPGMFDLWANYHGNYAVRRRV